MQHRSLSPLGAEVTELTVDALDETAAQDVRMLLATDCVVVIPDQESVDDDAFLRFLRSFGDLTFTVGETPVPTHPDLNVISNVGRTTPPKSTFHVDTSYVRHPPPYTALRAVDVPEQGGHTLFSDQYAAYDTLPAPLRRLLEGRTITHVATGVDLSDEDESAAQHPVFQEHPISGRRSLYLSTPQRCQAVSGMDDADGKAVVEQLFAHSTREPNVLRHRWRPGDIVMWDNRCVMHCADHSGVVGDRVFHRGMVAAASSDATA